MAAVSLTPDDLAPFADIEPARAAAMIEDALATAAVVAPCITSDTFEHAGAARAILRRAVVRWHEAGTGALSSRSTQVGPFGQTESLDTRQRDGGLLWPSEIAALQGLCKGASASAFSIDTVSNVSTIVHADICSLRWVNGTFCSCGASLAGVPIYE